MLLPFTPIIPFQDFFDYFKKDKYLIKENKAYYYNSNTGVYFCFEYKEEIVFCLDNPKPYFFILEANFEIHAFAEYFQLSFDENYLEQHYQKLDNIEEKHFYYHELEFYWHWNFYREYNQSKYNFFLPQVMFIEQQGQANTMIMWNQLSPILFPKVDYIIILKDSVEENYIVLTFQELEKYIKKQPQQPYFTINKIPATLKALIRWHQHYQKDIKRIAVDRILDRS